MLSKDARFTKLVAINAVVKGDVIRKQITIEINNIGLSAVKQPDAVPGFWPNGGIHIELEILDGLLVIQHGREVVGDSKQLIATLKSRANVLLNG